jgi:hypothetical protein
MVGDVGDRKLKTKGAETYGVMLFCLDVLERSQRRLDSSAVVLLSAGRALERFVVVFDNAGVALTQDETQAAWSAWNRHVALTADMEDVLIPKRHMILHTRRGLATSGNPRHYSNWQDEGLNTMLKKCCRTVSQATFEVQVLCSMRDLLPTTAQRKRKR